MRSDSFAAYLRELDDSHLTGLLRTRPDVLTEPVPRGFGQLAQRLNGADSLARALHRANRDALLVTRLAAVLDTSATEQELADVFRADPQLVRAATEVLLTHGLAWLDGEVLRLPERLANHWTAEISAAPTVAALGKTVLADDLRAAADAWGIPTAGVRKPVLIEALSEVMADRPVLIEAINRLSGPAKKRLDELRGAAPAIWFPDARRMTPGERELTERGLVLRRYNRPEVPREVAVAAWLADAAVALTGPPNLPKAPTARNDAAAVPDALRALTSLLDEATTKPIARLKKGGVGARERGRLAAQLTLTPDAVTLWLDLAATAGLLGLTDAGYAPTEAYAQWRAADHGERWAVLATAWFAMDHAPTHRTETEDKEVPPPLPIDSLAGALRRALLRAALRGASVRAIGREIHWFCPAHPYEPAQVDSIVAAAIREGQLLGVLTLDALAELGEHLLAAVDGDSADPAAELARLIGRLIPADSGSVLLQSDLTAVVSGQPSQEAATLLAASARGEARGAASVWRFSPDSVRAALDAGWTDDALRRGLRTISGRALPQPLDYLITDVSRRHGHVRVRGVRCCIVADEPTTTELLHTRQLAKLGLALLAPTVLSSPSEPDEVLGKLRAAGFFPVAEDDEGKIVVPDRRPAAASTERRAARVPMRRLTAAELADRLRRDPASVSDSTTSALVARLNPRLDEAERQLLAHAVDHGSDVLITYVNQAGNRSVRVIRPEEVEGRWIHAWCHLRNDMREFTVGNIQAVSPAT